MRSVCRVGIIDTIPLPDTILSGRIFFADKHRHQWIVSRLVMAVEIFVPQRQTVNPPVEDQVLRLSIQLQRL